MRKYDDCCNEFWNVTTYAVKGLCRKEILFAIDHLNQILRHEILGFVYPEYDKNITRYTKDLYNQYFGTEGNGTKI